MMTMMMQLRLVIMLLLYAVNLAGRLLSSSLTVAARTLKKVGSNARIA